MPALRNPARFLAGLVIWISLLGGVGSFAVARSVELRPPAERVLRYATHSPARMEQRIVAIDNGAGWSGPLAGDPVVAGEDRTFIGTVVQVREDTAAVGSKAFFTTILLDPEYDPQDLKGAKVDYGESSGDTAWIIATLLPPKKREIVFDELRSYASAHSAEIQELLHPIEEQVVAHAEEVLEANLTPTMKRHEKEIDALLDKYRASLKDELLPVIKESLGPSAKEKAKPILTRIGRECWDALPMWEGGWALLKQKLPFTKNTYIDEWWQDFLENKAIPILKEHEAELMKAGEDLIKEGFKDPKVRAAVNDVLKKLAKDKDFRDLVRAIVEEALIKPFKPAALWDKIAADPKNRAHFMKLNESFAPVMQKVVRLVAVEMRPDGREGLSPEVARVLRRKVFNKDARWVCVTPERPLVPRTAKR